MDRFTVLNLVLFPYLGAALALGVWGGWGRGWPRALAGLLGGVLLIWGGLIAAVGLYFQTWQTAPDPPEEAFSDGGSLFFVLYLGWLPGLLLIGPTFGLSRWVRVLLARAKLG